MTYRYARVPQIQAKKIQLLKIIIPEAYIWANNSERFWQIIHTQIQDFPNFVKSKGSNLNSEGTKLSIR